MAGYRLLKHRHYEDTAARLPESIRRKALWAQVLLGTRGRTPNVKSTTGYNARWRRTPVQGYHYYLWWIPLSESELAARGINGEAASTILVHSIRHHDETDEPLLLRSLEEFEEAPLETLDPRFEEQTAVSHQVQLAPVVPATVKGLPGSGKTVALFYLVRDLVFEQGLEHLLYITYTSRLKRAAREFLAAQSPELTRRVHIRTLAELGKEITDLPVALDPMVEAEAFRRFLERQPASIVGVWRRYPLALYTEIRAHILGRTFPPEYPLPERRIAEAVFTEGRFDVEAYARARGFSLETATAAVRIAERLRGDRFFLDQVAAKKALTLLRQADAKAKYKLPTWLRAIDGLVIDEVQDLTLLQIAFLAELARMRGRERALPFVVAGDESQIVQPSGFDWGITKDLLRETLGTNPQEFEFRHQRRSPRNLAYVIDNAWNFYTYLPKPLRPSANRQSFVDDAGIELSALSHSPDALEENGRLLICPLPEAMQQDTPEAERRWREFVAELAELPGRALIDLIGRLPRTLEGDQAEEILFNVREIKGLERNTVLILGLNNLYEQAMALIHAAEENKEMPPLLEARRLIDEMRVAISRSTDKLIFLESPQAPVFKELGIEPFDSHHRISWEGLRDLLRTEQMSEIEVIEGYLDEVDDLIERRRWEQARARNRRAYEFAVQIEDRALQRDAQAQYVQIFLYEAAAYLEQEQLEEALHLNRQARALAAELGDPALIDEADEQRDALRGAVESRLHALITRQADFASNPAAFYEELRRFASLVEPLEDAKLLSAFDEAQLAAGWRLGEHLLQCGPEAGVRLATLFEELASVMAREQDETGARLARIVAGRYASLPHAVPLEREQVQALLHCIDEYLRIAAPLRLERAAYVFVAAWLEESYASLGEERGLYYDWAVRAERYNTLVGYPELDDRLWDLENRVELVEGPNWMTESQDPDVLRFGAFIAAYHDQPHDASIAWEKLGELELAIYQARKAGELERAYHLMRQARQTIPDALSTAVKLARQAEQLIHKSQELTEGERRALSERLTSLLAALAVAPENDEFDGSEA